MSTKMCVLEENKVCDECGECQYCDLDPQKICDNCCKCIDAEVNIDYSVIEIDEIIPFSQCDTQEDTEKPQTDQKKEYSRYKIKKISKNDLRSTQK